MEPPDPYSQQSIEGHPAGQGSKLKVSQGQPAQIEARDADAHWLRMDPSLTRAVLAKTEEELLGSLAALMRNKVEHEQVSRRFAQTQIDTEHAKRELERVKEQIRHAEEEVATRLNEQSRINEEIVRVRQELAILREGHQQHTEMVFNLKNETAHTQHALAEAHRNLGGAKEAAERELATHRETTDQLAKVKNEKATLEEALVSLQREVDERIKAREGLIAETVLLHQEVSDLVTHKGQQAAELSDLGVSCAELQKQVEDLRSQQGTLASEIETMRQSVAGLAAERERHKAGLNDLRNAIAVTAEAQRRLQGTVSEEQANVGDLLARKETLQKVVAEAADQQRALEAEILSLETRRRELTEAAEKAEQARIAEGLPLLFEAGAHHIAPEWDPYSLESEFHTDEELDAEMVAKLVSELPGLEGCLIVKNHGPVLASQMPERIHAHLKVPDRNYLLLFERLERKVEEYHLQRARLATFDLGREALTVAQANEAFVFVNHRRPKLRPGMPEKLASIVSEISKMYP